ncbi:MAG TPA: ABC transporter ATP-binding protein [Inquilinus sp.]
MTYDLELAGVGKTYPDGTPAVIDFDLRAAKGEFISFVGPSGCGKTTTLRMIAGFEDISAGDILVRGRRINDLPPERRPTSTIFQNFALFPHMTVRQNIEYGLRVKGLPAAERRAKADRMMQVLDLTNIADRRSAGLSGGQRQRTALARGLVVEPDILLLDEPLGALDANLRERMMIELKRIQAQLGGTFLHVTGNEQEALAMGHRTAVLDRGRIAEISPPQTLYNRPGSVRVARFLNCYNIFEGTIGDGAFRFAEAALPLPGDAPAGTAAYCIRADKVTVAEETDPAAPGEAALPGRFIASEYSGARVTYLFDVAGSRPVEVEYHLSHRRPESFDAGRRYALRWPAADALVFRG